MKSSSTGSDLSPFMKVKEELLRQRKKRRIGTRRGKKMGNKGRKKGGKEDDVAHQEGKKESEATDVKATKGRYVNKFMICTMYI